jgi:tetratricopeptide (TPR) repeat protein
MTDSAVPGIQASGSRAIAAGQVGIAATGDYAHIDARTTTLSAATIPSPAEVAAPPGTHNLPRRPARVFVGRDQALRQLADALAEGMGVAMRAIHGLGGVGKSELALQHAAAHRDDYTLIWWITAEDGDQIQAGLAALAGRLCQEIALVGTTADAAEWAVGWLQSHDGWLLILDNVDEPGDVEELLGQLDGGHILITTRRDTGWEQIADPVRLDILKPGPATDLITLSTRRCDVGDREAAAAIAAELGNLPLALGQAAAYITQIRVNPAAYLERLRDHPAEMYAVGSSAAQRTIARVWDITLEAIRIRDPAAITLLHILACYAPDNIPRVILGCDDTSTLAVDAGLGALASYSMITLTPDTVSMHRLVQAVILTGHPPDDPSSASGGSPLGMALGWLDRAIPADPEGNVAEWPLLRALVPHAESLAGRFPPGNEPPTLGRVLNDLGLFLRSQGQYGQALRVSESALAITAGARGPDHPSTAVRLGNLAANFVELGRPGEALPLYQRALAITEAAFGPDHPSTALQLGNLAYTYGQLGRPREALPLHQRALAITEAAFGPVHPSTAFQLDNLARTYGRLGRHGEALPLFQRALAITESTLGLDHPDAAIRLNNLALAHADLGRCGEALPLFQRALAITEATLGPDHPNAAAALGNLAFAYTEMQRPDEALPLFQQALAITEATLGPDHPLLATRLDNLALNYLSLRRPQEALPVQRRALAITEAALGPDHTDTAIRLNNLGLTYGVMGRPEEALPLQERALAITEAALGPDHPTTALRLRNLAFTLVKLGRPGEALPLQQRALAITEAGHGSS